MSEFSPEQTSLTERVYEELRRAILAGELKPGTLHSVVEISARLGVSRTPVREALLRMASHGVVRFERSRGVRILQVSAKDIEEIYSLRLLLEVPSAHRAASKLSDERLAAIDESFEGMRAACAAGDESAFQKHDIAFHEGILEGADNHRVTEVVANTRTQMLDRGLSTTKTRTLWDILAVHERIRDALMARDADASALAMRDHLLETTRMLIAQSSDEAAARAYEPPLLGVRESGD